MDDTHLPLADAKAILTKTVVSTGYSEELAEDLVSSALWLEARGAKGVRQLIAYLLLFNGMTQEELRPHKDPDYAIRSICPVMAANVLANKIGNEAKLPGGTIAIRGPASAILMAPILTALADVFDRNLRLWFGDTKLAFSKQGWARESNTMVSLYMFDRKAKDPTAISFITREEGPRAQDIVRPFEKLETVALPTRRLSDQGMLNLSGEKLS